MAGIKKTFDKAAGPFVLGGWLLLLFFGASANAAELAHPDPATMGEYRSDETFGVFYGLVWKDIIGAFKGMGTFASNVFHDAGVFGGKVLSGLGVNTGATAGLASAFNIATGLAIFGVGLYIAAQASSATFDAKPA